MRNVYCSGIADIDLQDSDNPQLCAEYAPFMYGYLRQLERQLAIKQDFLKVGFIYQKRVKSAQLWAG